MCTWKEIVRNCQSLFGQKRKIRVYLILSISFVNCSPYNIEKREECKLQSKLKEASSLSLREWRTDRCWCVLTEFHLSMSKGLIFWQTWTDTVVEEVFGVWKLVAEQSLEMAEKGLGWSSKKRVCTTVGLPAATELRASVMRVSPSLWDWLAPREAATTFTNIFSLHARLQYCQ